MRMIYFDPIMLYSAGNDQIAFMTFLLPPDADQSTFITGRAHYDQLIKNAKVLFLVFRLDNPTYCPEIFICL